jgi:hypothetical protein
MNNTDINTKAAKSITVIDIIGMIWFVFVAFTMFKYGHEVKYRLANYHVIDWSNVLPNYTMGALLLIAVFLRLVYSQLLRVRQLYAWIVVGAALALSVGMKVTLGGGIYALVMNVFNIIFALLALRGVKHGENDDEIPQWLRQLDVAWDYVVALFLFIQFIEFVSAYGFSNVLPDIFIAILFLLLVFVLVSHFTGSVKLARVFSVSYYVYSVLSLGVVLLVCYYFVYTDVVDLGTTFRTYFDFKSYGLKDYYPYDDIVVYRALNILLSSFCVVRAFKK